LIDNVIIILPIIIVLLHLTTLMDGCSVLIT